MIELGCTNYRNIGWAEIEKTPEPFIVIKTNRNGTFEAKFTGLAQPDFQGTLSNGRSIVFEAKATSTNQLNDSVISKNQRNKLDTHMKMGAMVGVCCCIGKTYAFVPWKVWTNMKEIYGRKYLTKSDILEYQVKTPGYIAFLNPINKEKTDE